MVICMVKVNWWTIMEFNLLEDLTMAKKCKDN